MFAGICDIGYMRLYLQWSQFLATNVWVFLYFVLDRPGQNPGNLGKFFSKNSKFEFSILAVGQNRKLEITFPWFPRFPTFPSFQSAIFSFFKKNFFNILEYRNSRPYMFLKIRVLKNLYKTCVAVSFLKDWQLIRKRLQNRCFPANIAKFLRTAFIENPRWLLLKVGSSVLYIYVMYVLFSKPFKVKTSAKT